MIEREKIRTQVKELVEKNKLQKCFIPIIEEFFFRVADQCNWKDEEFENAITRYEKLEDIKFENMPLWQSANNAYYWDSKRIVIHFNVNHLKNILKFDKEKIENWINDVMHEQSHLIQIYGEKENKYNTGFLEVKEIGNYENVRFDYKDGIINEFAEVINAARLQSGNIKRDKYYGYEDIQTAGKIVLNSLGISELELANLQFEPNSRDAYKKFINNRLGGVQSNIYMDGFSEILDAIYKFTRDKGQRDNLILQVDALQTLSKKVFEDRFEDIMINSSDTLTDLAKCIINEEEKNILLKQLFYEFNIRDSELQMDYGVDIYTKLSDQGYDDEYLEKLDDVENEEKIKIQEQTNKQNEKHYDNEELIEKIYQSFIKYPIREVPLKDRPGVILSKIIGKIKRISLKQNNLLPQPVFSSYNKHIEFADRISDLEEYEKSKAIGQENNTPKFREKGNKSNENCR